MTKHEGLDDKHISLQNFCLKKKFKCHNLANSPNKRFQMEKHELFIAHTHTHCTILLIQKS